MRRDEKRITKRDPTGSAANYLLLVSVVICECQTINVESSKEHDAHFVLS